MAKHGGNRHQRDTYETGNSSFADVRLTRGDKDAFTTWAEGVRSDTELLLAELLSDSYRISLKYDYNSRCFQSALTQQDTKHANAGIVVVSRSDDLIETVLLAYYKVFVMFPGERLPTPTDNGNWG